MCVYQAEFRLILLLPMWRIVPHHWQFFLLINNAINLHCLETAMPQRRILPQLSLTSMHIWPKVHLLNKQPHGLWMGKLELSVWNWILWAFDNKISSWPEINKLGLSETVPQQTLKYISHCYSERWDKIQQSPQFETISTPLTPVLPLTNMEEAVTPAQENFELNLLFLLYPVMCMVPIELHHANQLTLYPNQTNSQTNHFIYFTLLWFPACWAWPALDILKIKWPVSRVSPILSCNVWYFHMDEITSLLVWLGKNIQRHLDHRLLCVAHLSWAW